MEEGGNQHAILELPSVEDFSIRSFGIHYYGSKCW